jgi:hypothetical protein
MVQQRDLKFEGLDDNLKDGRIGKFLMGAFGLGKVEEVRSAIISTAAGL